MFFLSCIVLILGVLLQPGKADAGALFSSSVSSTAFGPRGTQTLLAKITIGAAAVFMLSALTLSLPALTRSRSVLQTAPEATAPAQPQQPTAAPADANPATTAPVEPSENAQPQPTPAPATPISFSVNSLLFDIVIFEDVAELVYAHEQC
ncbi:MAG: preprotein translocase subunit SecG, partial [Pyrinomonadaceae bacterium]